MPGYARPTNVIPPQDLIFTPSGSISSTSVQGAIEELDSDLTVLNSDVDVLDSEITAVDNKVVYSSASPTGSEEGTLWVDSNTFTTYVNSASGWQVVGGAGGGGSKAFSMLVAGI